MSNFNLPPLFFDRSMNGITKISHSGIQSYHDILSIFNIDYVTEDPWIYVGNTNRIQGWKIHISTIPVEIRKLLIKIVPYLAKNKIPFKIIKDQTNLIQLNDGQFGHTQVGKGITIYPNSDYQIPSLMKDLKQLTKNFHGPVVPGELKINEIMHARYGGFNPIRGKSPLGREFRYIYDFKGHLKIDSYKIPFIPPTKIFNPFKDIKQNTSNNKQNLLGTRYLLVELLRNNAKGATFKSIDLQNQQQVSPKIIKEGRYLCSSNQFGHDIRDKLKNQYYLHKKLCVLLNVQKPENFFVYNNNCYLVLEYLEGQSLESFCSKNRWNDSNSFIRQKILLCLISLVDNIKKLHEIGYVHRDLTPSNIFMKKNNQVYLIDLELTYFTKEKSIPFTGGTPGFMSPQQNQNHVPTFYDDIFALGYLMVFAFTTTIPKHFKFLTQKNFKNNLKGLSPSLSVNIINLISRMVDPESNLRPNLNEIEIILKKEYELHEKSNHVDKLQNHTSLQNVCNLDLDVVKKGLNGLLFDTIKDKTTNLWSSLKISDDIHSISSTSISKLELSRNVNRGNAGILYFLSCMVQCGHKDDALKNAARSILEWLLHENPHNNNNLPGLHFGDAGVGVAITAAMVSGLVEKNNQTINYVYNCISKNTTWPDFTHGMAGIGTAALYCSSKLADERFDKIAAKMAMTLIDIQEEDGSWFLPKENNEDTAKKYTGFAHGVAGIVYFLTEFAFRTNNYQAHISWKKGVSWLIKQSHRNHDNLEWQFNDVNQSRWKWWCNGSPGIALTFLRLYEYTKDPRFALIAKKALNIKPSSLDTTNLSLCHGLSGIGEIYLEAYRILKDKKWLEFATDVAKTIYSLKIENKKSVNWLVEDSNTITGDLMVGSSGILHFFLKFLHNSKLSFPLLLEQNKK